MEYWYELPGAWVGKSGRGRCRLYEMLYVEISSLGPEKLVVCIFLNPFWNKVDFFFWRGERKDTGYSKRDYKNGPLMIIGYQDS